MSIKNRIFSTITLCAVACFTLAVPMFVGKSMGNAYAQERFVTQSGGRGLQNAKTNARVSKAENEIITIFEDLDDIEDFARVEIASCDNTGNKLRWTGSAWSCDEETDPTVQEFAKSALPTCGAGTSLSSRGGRFVCAEDGGLLEETDPTVQDFAKNILPNCGANQVVTTNGSSFVCIEDAEGLSVETDPTVATFAQSAPPSCGVGQVLSANGSGLFCVADDTGLGLEVDPAVSPFARNDIEGYTFSACAVDNVLTTNSDGSELLCIPDQGSAADSLLLGDLGDVDTTAAVNNRVLAFQGGVWVAAEETDPTVQPFARNELYTLAACGAGEVLSTNGDGSQLTCITDAGGSLNPQTLAGLGDVSLASPTGDEVLRFDGTNWINSDDRLGNFTEGEICRAVGGEIVCNFPIPSVCSAGNILQWTGTAWACGDAGASIGGSIRLSELEDVNAPAPTLDDVLRYNGTNWVNDDDKIGALNANQWCQSDGNEITCNLGAPVSCTAPDVIRWTGTAWQCTDIASSIASNIDLNDINDVNVTGAVAGQVLQFNGTNWVDATLNVIAQGDSQVVVADNGTGAVQIQVDGGAALHIDGAGNVGIGDTTPDARLDVAGNVQVDGNLTVGGTISATEFFGDGSNLTGVTASSIKFDDIIGIPTGVTNISNTALDTAELEQLQNIDGTTISTTQFGFVGNLNQGLATTDDVTFNQVTSNVIGNVTGDVIGNLVGNVSATTVNSTNVNTTNLTATDITTDTIESNSVSTTTLTLGGTTLTSSQFENLDGLNQELSSTSDVTFNTVTADIAATNVTATNVNATNLTTANVITTDLTATSATISAISATDVSIDNTLTVGGNTTVAGTVSATAFVGDGSGLTGITADDADTLDGLDSLQFLRSDADDTTTGRLTAGGLTVDTNTLFVDDVNNRVGIGTLTPGTALEIVGTVSATAFIGDGSGLTNIPATAVQGISADRIVSGTTNVIAAENASVTISTVGVQRAVIGTDGRVGIGTSTPAATLHVAGPLQIAETGTEICNGVTHGQLRFNVGRGTLQLCRP